MDDKYKIINYLNYRVARPTKEEMEYLLRANFVVNTIVPDVVNNPNNYSEEYKQYIGDANKITDDTNETMLRILRRMYDVSPNYADIPFYMLNLKELAYTKRMSQYAFVMTEEEKRLFADLNETLFANDELTYDLIHSCYTGETSSVDDFLFAPSCDKNILTETDKQLIEDYKIATKRKKEGIADFDDELIIKEYERYFADGKETEPYKGRYPKLNELWGKVYESLEVNDFKDHITELSQKRYTDLTEFFNVLSTLQKWSEYKKVYTLSNDLFDDFYAHYKEKSDIEIPLSVLDNIPFDTFYINLRNNRLNFSPKVKTEGMLIRVLRDSENKILGFNIFSAKTVNGTDYSFGQILFDFNLHCEITKDNMLVFSKEKVEEQAKTILKNNPEYFNESTVKKATIYHTKLFYIALQSVFYLCCTNKKMDKHYVALNSHSRGECGEENIEDITIGFVYTNELRNQIKESENEDANEETVFVNNTGRGTHRPHLVRGHFHHYHTKDGLILKYLEPYFTGVGKDFITHTIVKAPKEMQTFSKKDADINIKGNDGQVKA